MAYTPTNWQNNRTPAINETNLNKLEQAVSANDVAITGKAPLNHTHTTSDIQDLDAYGQAVVDSKDAATLQAAKDYTYPQATIDSKDAATLATAQADTFDQTTIDSKDATTLQAAKDYTYSQATINSKDGVVATAAAAAQATANSAATAAAAAQATADAVEEFVSGTRMVFYQAAPVGWVEVDLGETAWRMLMAGGGGGGSIGGSMSPHVHSHNTGNFALTSAHNGPHTHTYTRKTVTGGTTTGGDPNNVTDGTFTTGSSGSGTPHNHGETATHTPRYATVSVCQKS